MTAADAAPLTCEEEAAKLLPCICDADRDAQDHREYCPASEQPAVAAALRARHMAGRREAATEADIVTWNMTEKDHIASAIAALPEVP